MLAVDLASSRACRTATSVSDVWAMLRRAVRSFVGAWSPLPDCDEAADELAKMLTAELSESQRRGRRWTSFDELIERHRQILEDRRHRGPSEAW